MKRNYSLLMIVVFVSAIVLNACSSSAKQEGCLGKASTALVDLNVKRSKSPLKTLTSPLITFH